MKDGIRFNSTCLISPEELMVQITQRLSEFKSMPTAELEEFISPTDLNGLNYMDNYEAFIVTI